MSADTRVALCLLTQTQTQTWKNTQRQTNSASNDVYDHMIPIQITNFSYILYIFTPTQKRFDGKRRQIHNESYSDIHDSTRNFTLIPNLKSKKYFCLRIEEKIALEKICVNET